MSCKRFCFWWIFLISVILGSQLNTIYAASNNDGMVGYWKFDETDIGSSVTDASGDNNVGILTSNNPSPSTDMPSTSFTNARSLEFNGLNQYVYKSGPTGFNTGRNPRTITGWIKAIHTANNKVPFAYGLCHGGDDGRAFGVFLDGNDIINFWGCGSKDFNTGVGVTIGEWTHLAVTYDGTDVRVYKNGEEVGTAVRSLTSITDPNSVKWQVGSGYELDSNGYYFPGGIDDVRVYNRALTSTEISALAVGNHTSATWNGSSSTNTETAANWNINALPDPYTLITIADVANNPIATNNLSLAGLTINSGGSLSIAGYSLTIKDSGTFTNNGTLTLQGGETLSGFNNDTDSGTIIYNGSGIYSSGLVAGDNYNNLTLNGTGSWTLDAPLDVNGNLTITNGTLTTGGNNVTLAGNWSNLGSFTHGNATVTLDGTNQTVSGSTTFYNLTKSVVTARTLTFEADTTQTITNDLTLTGQSNALLSLHSSSSPTQWKIDPQGTRTLSYLSPQDSNNINSTAIAYDSTFSYGSNLTNWATPTATPTPTPTVVSNNTSNSSSSTNGGTTPICTDSKPIGNPDLFQIDTTTNNATLYFSPVNNISKYYISYSTNPSAEEHGAEITLGDEGVQNFTVNLLSPASIYYFKVRGQNGCMPGDWSDIKSATTKTKNSDSSLISTITKTVNKVLTPEKKLEIISSELSDKTEETASSTKEKVNQEGIEFTVLVKDSDNNPISGVLVTIHSKVQQATTDKNGTVKFENVEPGDHKVILAYNDYNGEQALTINESSKDQVLTLQIELKKGVSWSVFLLVIGSLSALSILLLIFIYKQKHSKKHINMDKNGLM